MYILTPNPIRSARNALHLTADEVCARINKILGSNKTKVDVSRWESSKHKPNQVTIFALAQVFGKNPITFYKAVQDHFTAWNEIFKIGANYAKNN